MDGTCKKLTIFIDLAFTIVFSFSGNCFIRTVVLTVFDKNGLFNQCSIYFSENHLNNDHHLTTRNTNDLQRG